MFRQIWAIYLLAVLTLCSATEPDQFDEELYIKPLHSGHIYTYFQFTTQWLLKNKQSCEYPKPITGASLPVLTHFFPKFFRIDHNTNLVARPLAEIFAKFDLMELHVSLSQGLWRYDKWGYPVGMWLSFKSRPLPLKPFV